MFYENVGKPVRSSAKWLSLFGAALLLIGMGYSAYLYRKASAPPNQKVGSEQQQSEKQRLSLSVVANGYSNHVMPPVGYATTFFGHGYTIHCVYSDGTEGIVGDTTRPCKDGDMLYQYVRDTTGKSNSVTYEFVRFR